jgi:multidrug efflux pump
MWPWSFRRPVRLEHQNIAQGQNYGKLCGICQRKGESTNDYMEKIREAVKGIPGTEINVGKEANGPPTGKPVNIEVSGDDLDLLGQTANRYITYLDSLKFPVPISLKPTLKAPNPNCH